MVSNPGVGIVATGVITGNYALGNRLTGISAGQGSNAIQRLVERIGWGAVLGYAAFDLIVSRGAHWPWWALIALGPALGSRWSGDAPRTAPDWSGSAGQPPSSSHAQGATLFVSLQPVPFSTRCLSVFFPLPGPGLPCRIRAHRARGLRRP